MFEKQTQMYIIYYKQMHLFFWKHLIEVVQYEVLPGS